MKDEVRLRAEELGQKMHPFRIPENAVSFRVKKMKQGSQEAEMLLKQISSLTGMLEMRRCQVKHVNREECLQNSERSRVMELGGWK